MNFREEKKMQEETNHFNRDMLASAKVIDMVQDQRLIRNVPAATVLISEESDLSMLSGCRPGCIAFTAGGNQAWQKGPDGTWSAVRRPVMQIMEGLDIYLDGHTLVMRESEE